MILESIVYKNNKEYFDDSVGMVSPDGTCVFTDYQNKIINVTIFMYFFVTLYVAITQPIGGNVLLSVVLAMFFSSIFWIIKIVELIVSGFKFMKPKVDNKIKKIKAKAKRKPKKKTINKVIF